MIVTLRTIVSTKICKYGQLAFELKRFEVFIRGYVVSLFSDRAGKPMCVCSCNKNNKEQIKNKGALRVATLTRM